jgi:hypothetical protein
MARWLRQVKFFRTISLALAGALHGIVRFTCCQRAATTAKQADTRQKTV